MTGRGRGHTVLVVPVPELEAFVRERTEHYDASFISADPAFVHAHVTVLGPFVPEPAAADLTRVGEVVAGVAAFDYRLDRMGEFADGVLHLLPEPDAPFRELTRGLVEAFPECPPYGGGHDPVPHLTLDRRSASIDAASVRAALGDVLPARCRADRVALHRYANHACRVLAEWKLPAS